MAFDQTDGPKPVLSEVYGYALRYANGQTNERFTLAEIQSRSRKRDLAITRHWFCWYLRVHRLWSFARCAQAICRDDHSTAMNSIWWVNRQIGAPKNYPFCERQREKPDAKSLIHTDRRNALVEDGPRFFWGS